MRIFEEVWKTGTMGRGLNEGLIVLILNLIYIWGWVFGDRLFYKLFIKIFAVRIEDFMDLWVQKEQRGFIKGRCILDNLILVREVKWFLNENKITVVFMSFDFSKVYDRVLWRFLWRCMR